MAQMLVAVVAGIVFGLGLAVSQMVNPAKVLAFLDLAGDWDPSLAFVMAGAVAVSLVAFRYTLRRRAPMFARSFALPARADIDARLVAGAATFGIGWGLVGFCPGPAVASLAFGQLQSVLFVAAMVAGMAVANLAPGATKPVAAEGA